jgi:alanine-synthesizing transaminase
VNPKDPFSRRSAVTPAADAFTAALSEVGRDRSSVVDLTVSNPTRVGLSYPSDILQPLAGPGALSYSPRPLGVLSARRSVAEHWAGSGVDIDPGRVMLTASTSEAYGYLFKLLCDPGDVVLVPRPSYPLLEELARCEGVRLRHYSLAYDGAWHIDLESVRRVATVDTRAIVAISPGNPTGACLTLQEYRALAELGLPVISDEVFGPYVLGEQHQSALLLARTVGLPVMTFALQGLSKSVGLPQLKLAWCGVVGPEPRVATALHRLEYIADAYLSVAAPVQLALPSLLQKGASVRDAILQRTSHNLALLGDELRNTPVTLLSTRGGWSAMLQLPNVISEQAWCVRLLNEDRVLVQPGWFYDVGLEPVIVLSLLTPTQQLESGIRHILDCVGRVLAKS